MNNPTLLTIFALVFILLGAHNLYTASKRAREAKLRHQEFKWSKQINALVGIEYLLLAWVFMLNDLFTSNGISPSLKNVIFPVYLFFLLAAALFAGLVIRRAILNARSLRQARATAANAKSNGASRIVEAGTASNLPARERTEFSDRRRERRKNAASARRRRAGKA
jgi:hypothetical protein